MIPIRGRADIMSKSIYYRYKSHTAPIESL